MKQPESQREQIAILFSQLYRQLIPDDFITYAKIRGKTKDRVYKMCLLNYGHRIPGVLFITTDQEIFDSFTSILMMAIEIIDHEPEETICLDTDMDSYQITPIFDLHHGTEQDMPDLPTNPLVNIIAGVPQVRYMPEDETYTALIIRPLDYHS